MLLFTRGLLLLSSCELVLCKDKEALFNVAHLKQTT